MLKKYQQQNGGTRVSRLILRNNRFLRNDKLIIDKYFTNCRFDFYSKYLHALNIVKIEPIVISSWDVLQLDYSPRSAITSLESSARDNFTSKAHTWKRRTCQHGGSGEIAEKTIAGAFDVRRVDSVSNRVSLKSLTIALSSRKTTLGNGFRVDRGSDIARTYSTDVAKPELRVYYWDAQVPSGLRVSRRVIASPELPSYESSPSAARNSNENDIRNGSLGIIFILGVWPRRTVVAKELLRRKNYGILGGKFWGNFLTGCFFAFVEDILRMLSK